MTTSMTLFIAIYIAKTKALLPTVWPVPNISYNTVNLTTKGLTASTAVKKELQSFLNYEQQRVLINEINRLSAIGTPPTVDMVRIFASNIAGKQPGIHWASRFCKQHHQEIASIYL